MKKLFSVSLGVLLAAACTPPQDSIAKVGPADMALLAAAQAMEELGSQLPLEIQDVLGDGRLTDVEILSGASVVLTPGHSVEDAQAVEIEGGHVITVSLSKSPTF